jgi:NAD(P)-dependent dehydrogenase (short-subunit alcohol dehydrogenase family)
MRIVVTGTTGGIGGAVGRAAASAGHEVVAVNRGDFDSFSCGEIDAVVFASGICPVKPVTMLTDGELSETFDVNCGLFLRLMRRMLKERMFSRAGAAVVAVSSVSAVEGWPGGAAYCASKGALSAACRALDAELAPRKISVRAIEPRYVKTAMFDRLAGRMGVDPALAVHPDELAAEILELVEKP